MTYDRKPLIGTAMGRTRPDLVIRAVELVNVLSREIHTADILVKGERIAAFWHRAGNTIRKRG